MCHFYFNNNKNFHLIFSSMAKHACPLKGSISLLLFLTFSPCLKTISADISQKHSDLYCDKQGFIIHFSQTFMFYSWDPGFRPRSYKGTVFFSNTLSCPPCLKNNFRQCFTKIQKRAGKSAFLICEIQFLDTIFIHSFKN